MSLDHRFALGGPDALRDRPARGWIRAIRDALGMTSRQLANRMGVSQPAIVQLEQSEVGERIRLDSLRRAADAMDCELVYALVPRTSLEETVQRRAQQVARHDLLALEHALSLVAPGGGDLKRRTDEAARHVIAGGRMWDESES